MTQAAETHPDLDTVLNDALYLAVCTLAFHTRDRGTDRQEAMLDSLETLALALDTHVRAVQADLAARSAQIVGGWASMSTAPRDGTWFIARSPTQVRIVRFLAPDDRLPCGMDERIWTQHPTHYLRLHPVIANLIEAQIPVHRNRLPQGHQLIRSAERPDGLVSQTICIRGQQEYERVVHPDEAYAD